MVPDLQFPSALRFPLPGSEVEATGHAPQLSEEAGEMSGPQLPVLWVLAHPFAICWGGGPRLLAVSGRVNPREVPRASILRQ